MSIHVSQATWTTSSALNSLRFLPRIHIQTSLRDGDGKRHEGYEQRVDPFPKSNKNKR